MKKNSLSPDLDLLCKALCQAVLGVKEYHNLSSIDLNKVSTFLIRFNPDFSSSKESLNKSLQNWFLGKNTPSSSKTEDIAKSLGYEGYHDFVQQNKRKIQANQWKKSASLNPFQKTLLASSILLLGLLSLPLFTDIVSEATAPDQGKQNTLFLASIIQAVVVVLFYIITAFSDFGGRDRLRNNTADHPVEVRNVMHQFFKGWKNLWLSFSILYIWFCIMYGSGISTNAYAQSFSDIITILSSICFAYLFSVMDVESIPRNSSAESVNTFYTYLITFTIGLSISTAISILDRYYHLGFMDGMGAYILGYANVIVMLYFFGRLESHYLNINRLMLLPLYTYAIIQIAYVLFFSTNDGGQSFESYIIAIVLILKGFLYFLIREWIKEGKMEHYFLKQRERKVGGS